MLDIIRSALFVSTTIFLPFAYSKPYIPENENTVIAKASTVGIKKNSRENVNIKDEWELVEYIRSLLEKAVLPGNSHNYAQASKLLRPWLNKNTKNISIHLAWAQILQHEHKFEEALIVLKKVLIKDPRNTNANLMAARITMLSDDINAAKKYCGNLLGVSDLTTASVCLLEVASHNGNLKKSYQQLKKIITVADFQDGRKLWSLLTLSDMALRLNNLAESEYWLDQHQFNDVSYLVAWADIKLAQGKAKAVIEKLEPIAKKTPSIEDSLLLQLALAEKHEKSVESKKHVMSSRWHRLMRSRIALRELRKDELHASDIARYYLDIEPNREKSLKWALINWQYAKEYKDKKLLQRAKAFSNQAESI